MAGQLSSSMSCGEPPASRGSRQQQEPSSRPSSLVLRLSWKWVLGGLRYSGRKRVDLPLEAVPGLIGS
jgi:hypothetical protein